MKKKQFLTIAYLVKVNLGIFVNQIEMEQSFFYCRYCHKFLLILMWCEGFYLLVLLIKNWLDDPLLVLRINEDLNMWMGLVKLKRRY